MLSLARRRAPTRLLRRLCSDAHAATPEETVTALDEHIVGQQQAKKAVAIALRDRWRRQQLPEDLQQEIMPNNILMVGPTGVGKTEIARRLARLSEAPFVKVEATKYTEVGIYGTDTEDMIKDLVEVAIKQQIERARAREKPLARERAEQRVAALLLKALSENKEHANLTREACLDAVRAGTFDDEEVAVESRQSGPRNPLEALFGGGGGRGGGGGGGGMPPGLAEAFGKAKSGDGPPGMILGPFDGSIEFSSDDGDGREPGKPMAVRDALPRLEEEELDGAIDRDACVQAALTAVQQQGIVFVDEIDKVVKGKTMAMGGIGGIKGEGVQKELLALLEGTMVGTRHGLVSTAHILFVCAGAFHQAKPADLLPELQGRLPVRVELKALVEADLERILKETKFNLLMQQTKLLATEGVELSFTADAVTEIARLAAQINSSVENIGARRLRTVLSKVMERLHFGASKMAGQAVVIDADYVRNFGAGELANSVDVNRYIL